MDFSSSTATESPACPLCQKSFNLFRSKNHCNLCNQDFCSSCRHKTNFLISQLNSKSACKVCAIVCLVPQLDSTQITKLPIKLSMGILKAYDLPKNQFLERKDIVLAIINKTKFTQDTIRLYRNNWNVIEKEIIVWKNLLPQISNALESGFKESESRNGNVRIERNSSGNGNIGNTSTSGSSNQQNSSAEIPSFGLDGLSEIFNGLPFGNNNNNSTNQTQHNNNYNYSTNNNPVNFNPIQEFFHGLNTTFNGNDTNQQQQAQYTSSTTQTNANYNNRPNMSNNTQSATGNGLNQQQNNTQPRPQPSGTNININHQMNHPSSQNKETANTKQILENLIKSEDYEDKVKKLPVKQLKQILKENLINFEMILEKKELINKVNYLIHSTKQQSTQSVTNNEISNPKLEEHGLEDNFLSDENLCKICYENSINCVLLDCGHSIACVECERIYQKLFEFINLKINMKLLLIKIIEMTEFRLINISDNN
ncbi:hypothetical protein K502DRAFT_341284 [Neoconidiobolus thromboides FSU 785]|nr:hypothetical protein K502DRAFT_341284 [Neoconidiobolus thromboides FSU 785]